MELWGITCVLLIVGFISHTGGLFCYQCGSTGSDGHCKADIKGMAKSGKKVMEALVNSSGDDVTDDIRNEHGFLSYIKKCDSGKDVCMIEEVVNSQTSGVLSYIRDCSDGKTFSFDNVTVLKDLTPNNYTTCGYDKQGYLFCVSLCKGHFCNGPNVSLGAITEVSLVLLIICIVQRFIL